MPLDAAGWLAYDTKDWSLDSLLRQLRIKPISMIELYRYKTAQVAKHPGNWLYEHQHQVVLVNVFGMLAIIIGASLVAVNTHVVGMLTMGLGSLFLAGIHRLRVRHPARWDVAYVIPGMFASYGVPAPIAKIAEEVRERNPYCTFMVGTLTQHETMLDPYLVVKIGDEQACLGIWDDTGIIQQACYAA